MAGGPESASRGPCASGSLGSLLVALAVVVFGAATLWALSAPEVSFALGRSMVSDLGARTCTQTSVRWICSPRHAVFNAGEVLAGVLLVGAAVVGRVTAERAISGTVLSAGGGLVLLGLCPSDVAYPAHMVGAVLALPLASGLLLAGGIHARADVGAYARRVRVVLGATALGACAIHLAPGDALRGLAEVVSVGAVCAALLVEAARGRRVPGPASRPQVAELRPEHRPAPLGSVADPPG